MSGLDSAKLLLKSKYRLVHVPNRHKVERWATDTRAAIHDGLSAEHAGMQAARAAFSYEYRGADVSGGVPVERILETIGAHHGV